MQPSGGVSRRHVHKGGALEARLRYAGLGIRFAALCIDFAIFCVIFFPVTRIVKGTWLMTASDHAWVSGWIITDPLCIVFLFAMLLYFVVLEGLIGGTLGKLAVGIRVIGTDGSRTGIGRSVVRNLLRVIDGLPAFNILGVILILRSPEQARFGDRVAGTRVVLAE